MTRPRSHRTRRPFVVFAIILALALVAGIVGLLTRDPNPLGHWRTPEGERAYVSAYTEALATMPAPTRTVDLATDFGTVRAYLWETPAAHGRTPLVLFPGWTSGVPMWSKNLPGLAEQVPVWAFDALGDAGFSVQTAPLRDNADQAAWIHQALDRLGLAKVHVAGHSFGGWLAANYAVRCPDRVASLTLIDPPFVFQPLPLELVLKSIPAAIPGLPREWRDALVADIGGGVPDPNDPVARMITLAVEHYAPEKPNPELFTGEQLASLRMPVFVALAGRSFLPDADRSAAVAREHIRDVTVRIWPEATHSLPMEKVDEVNAAIVAFLPR